MLRTSCSLGLSNAEVNKTVSNMHDMVRAAQNEFKYESQIERGSAMGPQHIVAYVRE